jgi:NADPH-dependent glutamate synthase beta subunit-like oxidoreductase/NAD-dependent dihydropyrimidine dehydrogenase PreA subunit
MIGGSTASIRSALDMAKDGNHVYLVETLPGIGRHGLTSAGPSCDNDDFDLSLWEELKKQKNIEVLSNTILEDVQKEGGGFRVRIRKGAPRVIEEKCNDCKACIKVCPVSLWDDYNKGLSLRTAVDFLNCKTRTYNIVAERPICEETCPVNLDVRGYIGFIADGSPIEALNLIKERLPFPGTIGRVCPHPCEERCNRTYLDNAPLCIRDLKRFAADSGMRDKAEGKTGKPEANGKKVAIVGAGPSGLTCANDLAMLGYGVTVFEAFPVAGGMLAVGIPEYRLPRDVLNGEIDDIRQLGVEIKTRVRIGRDLSFDDLLRQGYDAIFVAVGAHIGLSARVEGEDAEGVVSGVDFLRDLNLGNEVKVEGRVAIIGGGNVAMDAARSSLRLGAREVTILYRRSRHEMPASDEEIDAALEEGIKIEYLVAPVGVIEKDERVAGIRCIRMELGEPDASGRRRPVPVEASEFEIELDMILPAIGQRADLSFLPEDGSIEATRWGTIVVDPVTLSTSKEGIFAAGDCVTGPGIAIDAIAGGKKAAVSIDNYLKPGLFGRNPEKSARKSANCLI